MNDECPWCGADLILDGALDVLRFVDGARMVDARPCCPRAAERPVDEWLGCSWEQMVREVIGLEAQRVEAGQAIERGRVVELAHCDGLIVERATVEIVTGGEAQRAIFAAVAEHHRHHDQPRGWHFGVLARRGEVIVGVAVCGRPVSRHLQARGVVEVTRCCTWGDARLRRDVASAIYRAAVAEYRKRKTVRMAGADVVVTEVVTYTLGTESGASCRGAGFVEQGSAGGGSWDRPGRRRTDHAPTERKTRWSIALAT